MCRACELKDQTYKKTRALKFSAKKKKNKRSETGMGGGSNRTLEGGELAPKVAPRTLGLLTPKLTIFYRGSMSGAPGNSKCSPPSLKFSEI